MKRTLRTLAVGVTCLTAAIATTAAEAQTYTAQYFAVINANGATARSSGVDSSTRPSTGVYQVVFNRPELRNCAVTASLLGTVPGMLSMQVPVNGKTATIRTFTKAGAAANRAFQMTVLCGPTSPN